LHWLAESEVANNLPEYLQTPLPQRGQLKLLFHAKSALLAHTTAKHSCCDDSADETAEHYGLDCPAFQDLRQQLLTATRAMAGALKFSCGACCP
jgi:hypothetical protein